MRAVALVVVLATCVLAQNAPNSNLKNETAPGKYHDRYNNYRHRERHHYRPPLIDQFVCDLDATILVVASTPAKEEEKTASYNDQSYGQSSGGGGYGAPPSGYGSSQAYGSGGYSGGGGYQQAGGYGGGSPSYGGSDNYGSQQSDGYGEKKEGSYVQKSVPNAVRLKCSHIAIRSEHDCNSCCELAARRDHSVSRKDIFGFIIDADELVNSENGVARQKRSVPSSGPYNGNNGPAPPAPPAPAPYTGGAPPAPGYQQPPAAPPAPAPYTGSAPPASGYQQPPATPPAPSYGNSPAPEYQPSGDYNGGSSQSYSSGGYSTDVGYSGHLQYPIPPKNARCVCCAPKRYEHHHRREHRYRNHRGRYQSSEEY